MDKSREKLERVLDQALEVLWNGVLEASDEEQDEARDEAVIYLTAEQYQAAVARYLTAEAEDGRIPPARLPDDRFNVKWFEDGIIGVVPPPPEELLDDPLYFPELSATGELVAVKRRGTQPAVTVGELCETPHGRLLVGPILLVANYIERTGRKVRYIVCEAAQ